MTNINIDYRRTRTLYIAPCSERVVCAVYCVLQRFDCCQHSIQHNQQPHLIVVICPPVCLHV